MSSREPHAHCEKISAFQIVPLEQEWSANVNSDEVTRIAARATNGQHGRAHSQEAHMDITTILVIVLIVLLLGGGGFYGRGRWY